MLKPRILVLPLASMAVAAQAIVIRHDRPDRSYVDLAKRYSAVCQIAGDGHGTLIAPQWVLTAAHVTDVFGPFSQFVTFGGRRYRVTGFVHHPSVATQTLRDRFDLALVRLAEPVRGVSPIPLYRLGDEVGKAVVFVGAGDTGNGKTGPERNDGKWRAARNRVVRAQPSRLEFTFDAPPAGEEMEGISGPGDSGGPALIERDGKTWLAGVSSYNSGNPLCTYGTTEHYARVSQAIEWIEATMKQPLPAPPSTHQVIDFAEVPTTAPMAAVVRAFFEAFNTGSAEAVEQFNLKHRGEGFLADNPADVRRRRAAALIERFGKLTPVKAVLREQGSIAVLLRSSKEKGWHGFEFLPAQANPAKLGGILVTLAEPP